MLRNYFAAALRNFSRNYLYAGISIAGLALGFAAAVLIALFVRDELTHDQFWPGFADVYLVSMRVQSPQQAPMLFDGVPAQVAPQLTGSGAVPGIVARLVAGNHSVRHGTVEATEAIYWADPAFFEILQPRSIDGDLRQALERPDGIVLTESTARKYFGRPNVVGELMEIDRTHVMRVTAVVGDLPHNTHLDATIFASGRLTSSPLSQFDNAAFQPSQISADALTYVRIPAGAVATVQKELDAFAARYDSQPHGVRGRVHLSLLPLADLHLSPPALASIRPRGDVGMLRGLVAIGTLIVIVAAINFVILVTARASLRATEIAIRKMAGASRFDLIVQFIGEALLYSLAASLVALAIVELSVAPLSAFLQRQISLHYPADLLFCSYAVGVAVITGVAAGAYPALVVARFRPAAVLKGGFVNAAEGRRVRQILVSIQFAVLIGLIIVTATVYRQINFAVNQGARLQEERVVMITASCHGAFAEELRKLPGVLSAACSESAPFEFSISSTQTRDVRGSETTLRSSAVAPGFMELYGLEPIAGRFFSAARSSDLITRRDDGTFTGPAVLNEAAVRKLGFPSPRAAVGKTITWSPIRDAKEGESEIIGVVADFPIASIRQPIEATAFHSDAAVFGFVSVKLAAQEVPATLAAIDELWNRLGDPRPIERFFVKEYVHNQYADELRQGAVLATFSAVALFLACLGLFASTAHAVATRTREIGIRKATGATRGAIVKMLLWQFVRPVLLANLIAWPVGYYLAQRWLEGFAYHLDPDVWTFVGASAAALLIAEITVFSHAFAVASVKPAVVLRYE
jgi:putative ABC transport system permease protein